VAASLTPPPQIDAEGVLEDVERQLLQAFNSRQDNSVPEEFAVSGGYVFRHHPKVGVPYRVRQPSWTASGCGGLIVWRTALGALDAVSLL